MNNEKLGKILEELINLPHETEWLEFKKNNYKPDLIGEYISALTNSACLHQKDFGYLVFGIEDKTHNVVGTKFKPKKEKIGSEELENWVATQLKPRIDFRIYEFRYNNLPIVMFEVDATKNTPVKFKGVAYIRVGSYKKKLKDFPEKERRIWTGKNKLVGPLKEDWFAEQHELALSGLNKNTNLGYVEITMTLCVFNKKLNLKNEELLNLIKQSIWDNREWPLGYLKELMEFCAKRDGIFVEIDTAINEGVYLYWYIQKDGTFYLLHSLLEDAKDDRKYIWYDARILRIAKALLYSIKFYKSLDVASNSQILIGIRHGKFKGKVLVKDQVGIRYHNPNLISHENEIYHEEELTIKDIQPNLINLIKKFTDDFFELFSFYKVDIKEIENLINKRVLKNSN